MKPRKKGVSTTTAKPQETEAPPNVLAPTDEEIRRRAHEIYEARGGAPGQELEDWLLAELQLKGETRWRQEHSTG